MNPTAEAKRAEIDGNLRSFERMLDRLMPDHAGQFVLMRHGDVVGFFAAGIDAQIEGNRRFADRIFSIQKVTKEPETLGFYTYAVR